MRRLVFSTKLPPCSRAADHTFVEGFGIGSATLTISGNIIPGQTVLDFGQVSSGQSTTQTVTLTNTGTASLTIRRLTSQWPFLIAATNCVNTLAPSQSCATTLAYTPINQTANTPGPSTPDSGTLVIESDALSAPDLLILTGRAAPITAAAPSNAAPLVSYALSQSSLTFGPTQVGDLTETQTVTLSNTGTTTLHFQPIHLIPDFTIQSTCATLVPSQSCTILIAFSPQPVATNTTTNRISAVEIVSDSSTALEFISLLGVATPSPITVTPISLNFGSVQLGSTSTLPVQITNISTTPANDFSLAASPPYTIASDCPAIGGSLAASTSCTAQVTFTPTQTGASSGLLSVHSSLTDVPIIANLQGIGIQSHLQAVPTTLNFGNIALGASAAQTLTLTNTGTAPITNLALTVTGDYAITVPCTSNTLAPGKSCQLTVTFAPTALGPRNGAITSTDPNTGLQNLNIPLTGTGVDGGSFTLTVNGGPTATLTIPSEQAANYTLQLTPQFSYSGTVILNCTPVTPGPYATCSLLPSSINLNGAAQNSIANLNTVADVPPTTAQSIHNTRNRTLLCLLPLSLLFFWKPSFRNPQKPHPTRLLLFAILLTLPALWISGCGRGGTDPNLRFTPPGTYQYQVTATSTTGVELSKTVTLNLVVTAGH